MWLAENWWVVLVVLAILIVYWAVLMMTIADMIRQRAHTVVLVFACLSLGPLPPQVFIGILWIVFWAYFRTRLRIAGQG